MCCVIKIMLSAQISINHARFLTAVQFESGKLFCNRPNNFYEAQTKTDNTVVATEDSWSACIIEKKNCACDGRKKKNKTKKQKNRQICTIALQNMCSCIELLNLYGLIKY